MPAREPFCQRCALGVPTKERDGYRYCRDCYEEIVNAEMLDDMVRQRDEAVSENARLTALLAERDAEIARQSEVITRFVRIVGERDAEIKALVEAGRGLADALSAFSVDVGALPEIRQYRRTHLDADPPRDYPVTLVQPWGDYRVVDDRLEDWYAALAARGGEAQP